MPAKVYRRSRATVLQCLGVVWVGLLSGACDTNNPVACTAIYAYGLSVQAHDSLTGVSLGNGLVVTARDGDYLETLQSIDGTQFVGAGERAGSYTVKVTKAGYQDWERLGVVVTSDECHVRGVSITAKLQASP